MKGHHGNPHLDDVRCHELDEHEFDIHAGAGKLTRATVKKSYSGDVSGTSVTQWLMAYASDGTATFVGLERIDGTITTSEGTSSAGGTLTGTLVLQHVGTFRDGARQADLTVIDGSSGGDFVGTTGAEASSPTLPARSTWS